MNRKEVIYQVNGVAVAYWRRIISGKTFWIVAAFILTAADRWNKGEISGADFFQMVQIGVIGILIRAAMSRSELAANAANPALTSVGAAERNATFGPEVTGVATCLVAAGALLALTACTTGSAGVMPG